jgi:HAMP domain-containing protein
MKSSIRNKLILSIALPFLIIFIAAEGVTLGLLSKRAEQTLHDQSILIAKNLAERMDSQFREVAQIAHSTALYMETFSEADDAQLYEILTTNIERSPLIYGSAIAFAPFEYDENIGLYSPYVYRDRESMKLLDIARDSYDYTDGNWEWYSGPQQSGNAIWTTPFFDEGAGNILMITYAVPFYREDTFRGVATIDVPVDKLQELLAIDELQEFPFVIISAAGQFITHPDKNMIMSTSIMDFMNQKHMSEFDNIANELFMGKTGIGMVDNSLISPNLGDGKSWIFYSPIKSTNWVFATAVPEEVILSNLRSSLQLAAVGGIIMIILVLATILIISTHITKPITEMASAVADLSRGNLDTHVKGITTTDEIGQLAQGFNRMREIFSTTFL